MSDIQRAPLVQQGGIVRLQSLFVDKWLEALIKECQSQRENAEEQRKTETDFSQWRGSNPDRFLASAEGLDVQNQIYHAPATLQVLSELCGRAVRPTGSQGSYSYYDQEGHFLGLHRDINTCDLTLITCLKRKDTTEPSGALRVYRNCSRKHLHEIDASCDFTDYHLEQGESVVLLGGFVPHEVRPAVNGFERSISALCYEMV